jgi:chromosome segregation ATPase
MPASATAVALSDEIQRLSDSMAPTRQKISELSHRVEELEGQLAQVSRIPESRRTQQQREAFAKAERDLGVVRKQLEDARSAMEPVSAKMRELGQQLSKEQNASAMQDVRTEFEALSREAEGCVETVRRFLAIRTRLETDPKFVNVGGIRESARLDSLAGKR